MRTLRAVPAVLSLLAAGAAAGSDSVTFRELLERWRAEQGLPAVAAAVVTGDSVLDIGAVGVRRLGSEDSVRLDDRFHIGSNGKAMTGFLAGALVERGVLGWDTGILDALPGFEGTARAEYREKTLLDVLSHRAGIIPLKTGAEWDSVPEFEGDVSTRRRAFAGWLLAQPPVGPDSALGYRYSNGGYALAGALLEQAAGKTWERLMSEELFARAGMDGRSGWPARADPSQPWGHYYDADSGRLIPHDPRDEYQLPDICSAAGDISLSVSDYARFLQLNLLGLGGRDTLIRSATWRFLHTGGDTSARYAVGWGRAERGGLRVSRHDGSAGTFYCTAVVCRDQDLAVAVIVNAARPGTAEAVAALADSLLRPSPGGN
ncbi:MAG: beta-lactamase family protein [candidate division WOR-3 bacterium]|nr:MAG: beta-lactamase family protein [candidate division WOR-3 bacterium]